MSQNGTFGAWLKQRRNALDLTQEELADQVGCSVVMIRKMESNQRRPSKPMAERLAELLQIPLQEQAAFLEAARSIENGKMADSQHKSPAETFTGLPLALLPSTPAERNRDAMIQNVRKFWVEGVLENSLYSVSLIELGMEAATWAVDHPWDIHLLMPNRSQEILPSGTRITDVFDQVNGKLMILGDPGSGKTTLLLELARDLLYRAEQEPTHPIPVVFNLASWGGNRKPLVEWLVDELNSKYHVPRKIAAEWIAEDHLLLLFDGLDEIELQHRDACIEAINTYRREHGFVNVVVCSRIKDYQILSNQFELNGAVLIRPLDALQIDAYLTRLGSEATSVRTLLANDSQLYQLANSPLMLNVMLFVLRGVHVNKIVVFETIEAQRQNLFERYVAQMFERKRGQQPYSEEETRHYLAWLATRMLQHGRSIFHMEDLQPDWLNSTQYAHYRKRLSYSLILIFSLFLTGYLPLHVLFKDTLLWAGIGTLLYGVAGAVLGWIVSSDYRTHGIVSVFAVASFSFLIAFANSIESLAVFNARFFISIFIRLFILFLVYIYLLNRWKVTPDHIKPAEIATFSWSEVKWWIVIAAFIAGTTFGLGTSIGGAIGSGLIIAIVASMISGFVPAELSTRLQANQGILNSHRNGLRLGLLVAIGLAFASLPSHLTAGEGLALDLARAGGVLIWIAQVMYIAIGGYAVIQHYIVRHIFQREGVIPSNYAQFLDYATALILLRKVGGGYIFIHRYLLEYFAAQSLSTADQDTFNFSQQQSA